jgi:hypothetical protein
MPTIIERLKDILTSTMDPVGLAPLPGEQFSGLQLMCMMHVGFKRVDPSVDPGTGLDDVYSQALRMYHTAS